MPVEVLSYRLSLRGKPVGSQVLRTQPLGRTVALEARLMLQGSLGQQTVVQTSRLHRQAMCSLHFHEELEGHSERRRFDVVFDRENGLVQASRGPGDTAEIPYLRSYSDPLGLLYRVRHLSARDSRVRVPMLGKEVVIERLGELRLDTVLGEREAQVFALHPGGSFVYVDHEAPHYILKLSQRLDGGLLDAQLVKVAEEEMLSEAAEPKGGRRRSQRRRRRR